MSLVGSLEDLGLGDILQIVSLSRKSGLLLLRSETGDGRIVFRDGLVRAAYVKGEPDDLRGLLVPAGFIDAGEYEQVQQAARNSGQPLAEVVAQRSGLSAERIDSLRREHVERAVLSMFAWRVGEFSFEVRDTIEERDRELALPNGINAQYLTMEATRLGDEGPEPAGGDDSDDLVLSGEDAHDTIALAAAHAAHAAPEEAGGADEVAPAAEPTPVLPEDEGTDEAPGADEAVVEVAAEVEAPPAAAPSEVPRAEPATGAVPAPLVVVDPELVALEWTKSVLAGQFARIHIFQHSEGGIGRIRQYLSRGVMPTALVSARAPADSVSGGSDLAELLRRLRGQAPPMPVLVMHDGAEDLPPGIEAADIVVERPTAAALVDHRREAELAGAAQRLRAALEPWARRNADEPRAPAPQPTADESGLRRLKQMSDRLRDPATRGDVLSHVLDCAAQCFRRVAMFMVRDDVAVGIAQRGLAGAGGPEDQAFRQIRIAVDEAAWFREAVARREPKHAAPSDAGDRQLAGLLGHAAPPEAFVAPIESGGRVAALLYADNLPAGGPLGDTTVLSIVLHEAGLALDRALLERALKELGANGSDAA